MTWFIDGVIKYHRTFSEVVNTLLTTGFSIEGMLEPAPSEELIDRLPYYADELHKPNFLLIKVRKK